MSNPFQKGQAPREDAPPGIVSEDVTGLCPFVGTFPVVAAPTGVIRGPQPPNVQHVMTPCVEGRCAMWDETRKGCSQKLGAVAMVEIRDSLLKLAGVYGIKL